MSTSFSTTVRKKTGENCDIAGDYQFDGYTDGTWSPSPTTDEKVIPLQRGETFPPVRSCDKACWRKLTRRK